MPHLKSSKNQNTKLKSRLGMDSNKMTLTSLRSTKPRSNFCLGTSDKTNKAMHHTTKQEQTIQKHYLYFYPFSIFAYKARQRAKWAAVQVATMLAHQKQIDKKTTLWDQYRSAALGRPAIKLLGGRGGGFN